MKNCVEITWKNLRSFWLLFHPKQRGTLKNATRDQKPYTFDQYDLITFVEAYDESPHDGKDGIGHRPKRMILNQYGFVTSRVYQGRLNLTELQQDFTYHFVYWSWAALEEERRRTSRTYRLNGSNCPVTLSVLNSYSLSIRSLGMRIIRTLKPRPTTAFTQ
jgi:hypothetical protein